MSLRDHDAQYGFVIEQFCAPWDGLEVGERVRHGLAVF